MRVAVLVPWTAGCPHREAAWQWVQTQYAATHPDWELITGRCPEGPYNRAAAILDAADHSDADLFVVADADIWCDPQPALQPAIDHGWAIPHLLIHRLSQQSTAYVLAGADWHGLPLSTDNRQDSRPYRGHETGTLVVIRRDVLFDVPPDRRFVGWGSEDDAWACALRTLVGKAWRGSDDLVHLWHPPQPRKTRVVGTDENRRLLRRYRNAHRHPELMRQLLEEGARCSSNVSSPAPRRSRT